MIVINKTTSFKNLLFILILASVSSAVFTWNLLYSNINIFNTKNWFASKAQLIIPAVGGDSFVVSRNPLAGFKLRLAEWHGNQEVVTKKSFKIDQINTQLEIIEDSYIALLFNRNGNTQDGLLVSKNQTLPSLLFSASIDGQFLNTESVNLQLPNKPFNLELKNNKDGLSLKIDDVSLDIKKNLRLKEGQLGFIGGAFKADVFWIKAKNDGVNVFSDNFINYNSAIRLFLTWLILLYLSLCIIRYLLVKINAQSLNFYFTLVTLVFVTLNCLYFAFDFYFWSQKSYFDLFYKISTEQKELPVNKFESYRIKFTNFSYAVAGIAPLNYSIIDQEGHVKNNRFLGGAIVCANYIDSPNECILKNKQLVKGLYYNKPKNNYRLLVIGTSQMAGSGAFSLEQTFYIGIDNFIRRRIPNLESINMSESGANSKSLLEFYQKYYQDFKPDLAVINIVGNDSPNIEERLSVLIKALVDEGIRIVLINEAKNCTIPSKEDNIKTLTRLGKRFSASVLDLHGHLCSPKIISTGFHWWDYVHMRPSAQKISADWLAPQIYKILISKRPTKHELVQ